MRRFILLVAMLIACSGCSLMQRFQAGGIQAFDGVSQSNAPAAANIAGYAANHIAAVYPPGHTALNVNSKTAFGEALEASLRQRGFAVSPEGLPVGYTLDVLDAANCYLTLYLPDGTLSQSFQIAPDTGQATPDYSFTKHGLAAYTEYAPPPLEEIRYTEPAAVEPAEPAAQAVPAVAEGAPALADPVPAAHPVEPAMPLTPDRGLAAASAPEAMPKALAPEVAPSAAEPQPAAPAWNLQPGMLRPQIEDWAERAGYQVIWKSRHDFDLEAYSSFNDDFIPALQTLFQQMHEQGNPLRVTVYRANRVIEVTED